MMVRLRGPLPPDDPLATLDIFDDFVSGSGANGGVGALGWGWANGTGLIGVAPADTNHPGILRLDTGATSGTLTYLRMLSSNNGGLGVFLASSMFDVTWIFRLNINDANTKMRVGITNDISADAPVSAVYLEKLDADTQWFGVCRAASTQTRTAALATVDTGWHKIRIRRSDANTIAFSFDGGAEVTLATNVPGAVAMHAGAQLTNSAAASKTLDLDFFRLRITGMTR